MPTTALFTNDDLSTWLRQPVSSEAAVLVERVVWGWLSPLLGITDRPDPVSDKLAAWAIELGAIAYANPEGLSRYSLDSETSEYSSERRDEILRIAAGGGTTPVGAALAPTGCFPSARDYPDHVESC